MENLPALIDTAADRTVIPSNLAGFLGLVSLDRLKVAGLGGYESTVTAHMVELTIRTLSPQEVVVIAHDDEPYILLGRDVLNRYRLLLDGPALVFEIG